MHLKVFLHILNYLESKPNETGSGFKSNSNSHVRATDTQLLIKRKSTLLKLLNANNKSI